MGTPSIQQEGEKVMENGDVGNVSSNNIDLNERKIYYVSSRDPTGFRYSFQDGLRKGYAPDGGVFVRESFDRKIPKSMLNKWIKDGVSFPEMAFEVLRCFVDSDEIDDESLMKIITGGVGEYDNPADPIPVVRMSSTANGQKDSLNIAQLFTGPTFCFKDLGQQFTIRFIDYFAEKTNSEVVAICSTTGDTGPAALQAARNCSRFKMLVAHPKGAISNLQRRQMTTVFSDAAKTCVFHGGGDDLDLPIKNLMTKGNLKKALTGVNSYNIGRPVAQVLHYFWSYLSVVTGRLADTSKGGDGDGSDERVDIDGNDPPLVDFVVPTGAMGNITAGAFAREIGLPVGRFITSCNKNDVGHRAFSSGIFKRDPVMHKNLAEAMNIQVPYNFERLLYLAGRNLAGVTKTHAEVSQQLKDCMAQLEKTGEYAIPQDIYKNMRELYCIGATVTQDDEISDVISRYYRRYKVQNALHCPHSACAIRAAEKWINKRSELQGEGVDSNGSAYKNPLIVLATASWCKFEEIIERILTPEELKSLSLPPAAQKLMQLPEKPYDMTLTLESKDEKLEAAQVRWEQLLEDTLNAW